jgi:hypothetical protein
LRDKLAISLASLDQINGGDEAVHLALAQAGWDVKEDTEKEGKHGARVTSVWRVHVDCV